MNNCQEYYFFGSFVYHGMGMTFRAVVALTGLLIRGYPIFCWLGKAQSFLEETTNYLIPRLKNGLLIGLLGLLHPVLILVIRCQ